MYCLHGELELIAVSISHTPELALLQDQKGGVKSQGAAWKHCWSAGYQGHLCPVLLLTNYLLRVVASS